MPASSSHRLDYRSKRVNHWEQIALSGKSGMGGAYHRRLHEVYGFLIPPGMKVLEIGCGEGDLLAAIRPQPGIGVDFSPAMLEKARRRHPELTFVEADAHALEALDGPFDFIILSDLLNDVWDIQEILTGLNRLATPSTRLVLNFYSHLWEPALMAFQRLGLSRPRLGQNWVTAADIRHLLYLSGWDTLRHWPEVLLPLPLPVIAPLSNRYLAKLFPFKWAALSNFVLARPLPLAGSLTRPLTTSEAEASLPTVSVVVPVRNEEGNIPAIFSGIPEMGGGTEIIFVEGHSQDGTYAAVEKEMKLHPNRKCLLLRQSGRGKGDAVRMGFAQATGDILMIFDADLTVPPEDLPRFYEVIRSGKADFVNGVRLVYPMENQAMQPMNFLGNKFFSLVFSWLLGQSVKDTLCGTKVLWRKDYERLSAGRAYFGEFDPFGDFDLLFGAAKLNLKIVDLPVRYRERTYGQTNIQRWRHGAILLRMVLFAARRIKFT